MKISTEISSASKFIGEPKAVELYSRAGFDAWDFSMFLMGKQDMQDHPLNGRSYLTFARELGHIGRECGIVCNQSHALFPSMAPHIRPHLEKAIECTAAAGGEICVIHLDNRSTADKNAEMFEELLPFAKSCGVKIATENMFGWDKNSDIAIPAACSSPSDFVSHLDAINDEFLVACLDIGHSEMMGAGANAVDMIKSLGNKLKALHIHDNDRRHDKHQIPFSMDIDYLPILKALRNIGYDGYFTLEARSYLIKFNSENVFEGMCDLARAAKHLADWYEDI